MKFDLSRLEYDRPLEEIERETKFAFSLVDQVEAGTLTREAALEELIRRGSHPDLARRFLRHTLDQDKLDAERVRTGIIAD